MTFGTPVEVDWRFGCLPAPPQTHLIQTPPAVSGMPGCVALNSKVWFDRLERAAGARGGRWGSARNPQRDRRWADGAAEQKQVAHR